MSSTPPVEIVPAAAAKPTMPSELLPYQREPYATVTTLRRDTTASITSPDAAEGPSRFLPTAEAVHMGLMVIGPGGGETWHTHLSYYEIFFYIQRGVASFSWKDSAGKHTATAKAGDFVCINPNATHQWLNTGTEPLTLVWFGHFHNY